MKKHTLAWIGIVCAAPILLSGCTPGTSAPQQPHSSGGKVKFTVTRGEYKGKAEHTQKVSTDVVVHWLADKKIAVTTYGSSSCPTLPDRLSSDTPPQLLFSQAKGEKDTACTLDLAPTTAVFPQPQGWDPSGSLTATWVKDNLRLKFTPKQ